MESGRRCDLCQNIGDHWTQNCPNLICAECQENGHSKKECPNRTKSKEKSVQQSQSFVPDVDELLSMTFEEEKGKQFLYVLYETKPEFVKSKNIEKFIYIQNIDIFFQMRNPSNWNLTQSKLNQRLQNQNQSWFIPR